VSFAYFGKYLHTEHTLISNPHPVPSTILGPLNSLHRPPVFLIHHGGIGLLKDFGLLCSPRLDLPDSTGGSVQYLLQSVVVFQPNQYNEDTKTSGGHYFTYSKRGENWYRISDSAVSKHNSIEVILQDKATSCIYALYQQQTEEWNGISTTSPFDVHYQDNQQSGSSDNHTIGGSEPSQLMNRVAFFDEDNQTNFLQRVSLQTRKQDLYPMFFNNRTTSSHGSHQFISIDVILKEEHEYVTGTTTPPTGVTSFQDYSPQWKIINNDLQPNDPANTKLLPVKIHRMLADKHLTAVNFRSLYEEFVTCVNNLQESYESKMERLKYPVDYRHEISVVVASGESLPQTYFGLNPYSVCSFVPQKEFTNFTTSFLHTAFNPIWQFKTFCEANNTKYVSAPHWKKPRISYDNIVDVQSQLLTLSALAKGGILSAAHYVTFIMVPSTFPLPTPLKHLIKNQDSYSLFMEQSFLDLPDRDSKRFSLPYSLPYENLDPNVTPHTSGYFPMSNGLRSNPRCRKEAGLSTEKENICWSGESLAKLLEPVPKCLAPLAREIRRLLETEWFSFISILRKNTQYTRSENLSAFDEFIEAFLTSLPTKNGGQQSAMNLLWVSYTNYWFRIFCALILSYYKQIWDYISQTPSMSHFSTTNPIYEWNHVRNHVKFCTKKYHRKPKAPNKKRVLPLKLSLGNERARSEVGALKHRRDFRKHYFQNNDPDGMCHYDHFSIDL
jgi:hypothetical protein